MDRAINASSRGIFASFWKAQAAGWASFAFIVLAAKLPRPITWREMGTTLLGLVFMFLGSCTLRPICRALVQQRKRWMAFEIRLLAASAVLGVAWFAFFLAVAAGIHEPRRSLSFGGAQFTIVLFLWGNLYFSIKQWERLMRAETEARDARLAALRYQLNPHFLFNALNSVSTLVVEANAAGATRMLALISDYLRATLDTNIRSEVPLSDEIALTDRYLAIEQSRLAGRLCIERRVDPAAWDAAVPSLLLQPLVENAVRHGIAPFVEGGMVGIHCAVRDEQLHVTVRNSGPPRPAERRNGIGLVNTAERLRALYGSNHHFRLEWPDCGGCQATIRVPYKKIPCAS